MQITAQDIGGIGDGFAAADLHFSLIEIECVAAEFADTDFK